MPTDPPFPADPARCPNCSAILPAQAPQGLCPKCLFAGLARATDDGTGAASPVPVPRPEELAPHFPQLEILDCLGRGGMGVVYRTRQKSLDRIVALKLLAPERVGDPAFAERFAREAQALAKLNHPHIVTIHDFGEAGGFFYLLMEFVDGVNLRQAMQAGRFTPEQALAIVPPVCDALQYAHEHGIVHRDIKPENLLLDRTGRVMIADFGIAKMLGAETSIGLAQSQPAGTPQYMAPEQKDHRPADHRADIYSLGVVFYEMLTGELPAKQIEVPSRKVQLDVRIDEIVLRALERTPELRYQTAGEFRTQVETIAGSRGEMKSAESPKSQPDQQSSKAQPVPPSGNGEPSPKRSSGKRIALGCAVAAAIGFVVIAIPVAVLFFLRANAVTDASMRRDAAMTAMRKEEAGIRQVRFKFSHPDAIHGGYTITRREKAGRETGWMPSTSQGLPLKNGKTVEFKCRIDARDPESVGAWVQASLPGGNWETFQVVLGAETPPESLNFTNGLHVVVSLLEPKPRPTMPVQTTRVAPNPPVGVSETVQTFGLSPARLIAQIVSLLFLLGFLYLVYRVWRRYGWWAALLLVLAGIAVMLMLTLNASRTHRATQPAVSKVQMAEPRAVLPEGANRGGAAETHGGPDAP